MANTVTPANTQNMGMRARPWISVKSMAHRASTAVQPHMMRTVARCPKPAFMSR